MSDADVKLDVGREITRGLGAGADPEVGRRAAEDHAEEIEAGVAQAPTWCSSRPARAVAPEPVERLSWPSIAKSIGALTIGVVTKPFSFEGRRRQSAGRQRAW